MGCSRKASSEFYENREALREKVKGVKLFDDMIEEYRELRKERESLWELTGFREYDAKCIFRRIKDLWDGESGIDQQTLEKQTIDLLKKRREIQEKLRAVGKKMRDLSTEFQKAVGNSGDASIEDLI